MKKKTLDQLANAEAKRLGAKPGSMEWDYYRHAFRRGYRCARRRIKPSNRVEYIYVNRRPGSLIGLP